MNSIKPLITIAVLGGIGYVVYVQLNSKPSTPPPGAPQNWESATVQMPGEGDAGATWGGLGGTPFGGTPGGALPSVSIGGASAVAAPTAGPPGGAAPPYTAAPTFAGTGAPADAVAPNFDDSAALSAAAPNNGYPPADDKWGTTDPAAAVSTTPPPVANYGDAPADDANAQPPFGTTDPAAAIPGGAYTAPNADVGKQFQAAWETGQQMLDDGKLVEALKDLSTWHEHPGLTATENQRLTELLDQVAGTVIYSTQHMLEPAHTVKQGERLETIGEQYDVPWQLLAKINGIDDPASLQPGEQIKVVRGPFSAVIQVEKRRLTLMLSGMYAGRFLVGVGRDLPPRDGTFTVTEKVADPVYHGRDRTIPADDPRNPLGERWIALGTDMGIHGTGPLTDISSTNQPGSISMGTRDVEDVFDILSIGSKVLITR